MEKKRSTEYKLAFNKYIKDLKGSNFKIKASKLRLELQFESLTDWSQVHNFEYIKKWFLKKRSNPGIKVKIIPLHECKKWSYDKKKGFFFFNRPRSKVTAEVKYFAAILGAISPMLFFSPYG